jgi:predicted NBD/HSP70 family sugar kinase
MSIRTGSRRLMREVNSKLVLGLIRELKTTSQVELLKKTRLSAGTVANIVKELKGRGFVEEIGLGRSTAGRRPMLLQFNPRAQYVVGVEFTASQTKVALVDLAARIVRRTERPTTVKKDPIEVLRDICSSALSLTLQMGISKEKLLGVGIATEGIVEPGQGHLVLLANLGWRDVPVRQLVESILGVPTVVESSGMAMTFGEYLYGAGKGRTSVVCLDVDSGIGANVILDGRLLHGAHNMAGEIGHSLAVPNGEVCLCGKRGCLETVASAKAIIASVGRRHREEQHSSIPDEVDHCAGPEAIALICKAAENGDPLANQVIREAGRQLGIAAAGLVNFLDPELLILTGMVTYASDGMLLDVIREVAREHTLQNGHRSIRIEQGTLGNSAAIIGAAALVCDKAFRVPIEAGTWCGPIGIRNQTSVDGELTNKSA